MKSNIIVIGSGWGSAGFIKKIDTTKYNVFVISSSLFIYTPLMPKSIKYDINLEENLENINNIKILIKKLLMLILKKKK